MKGDYYIQIFFYITKQGKTRKSFVKNICKTKLSLENTIIITLASINQDQFKLHCLKNHGLSCIC